MSLINVNLMADSQGGSVAPISSVMRNRIINGAMVIDQRNAGASVTATTAYPYTLDRWQCGGSQNSKFTVQQSSTAPTGFVNSALITSSSAYSVGAGENFVFFQNIEGFNTADLGWGTANAKIVTLSFVVRSSLTGTFGGSIQNSATNRSYPFTYTINAANTFEYKTIEIEGDTSGTWLTTNGIGIIVRYGLGVGSTFSGTADAWAGSNFLSATGATSVVGTNGATFFITGVQLEKGTQATGFEYRQTGTELALCQRYFSKLVSVTYINVVTGLYNGIHLPWKVTMRASPTVTTFSTVTGASGKIRFQDGAADVNSLVSGSTVDGVSIGVNNVSTNFGSGMFVTVTAEGEL